MKITLSFVVLCLAILVAYDKIEEKIYKRRRRREGKLREAFMKKNEIKGGEE